MDLYYAQNLREEGGIRRNVVFQTYERREVGRHAQWTVWGFFPGDKEVFWTEVTRCHRRDTLTKAEKEAGENEAIDFFRRFDMLVDLGLIEWVPHLVEGPDDDALVIHPLGAGSSDSWEDRLGHAAHRAGLALLTEPQRHWVEMTGRKVVPIERHISHVCVFGIARLLYQPHTGMTRLVGERRQQGRATGGSL